MQHAERESACATEVSVRTNVGGRNRLSVDEISHPVVVVVVDHDEMVGTASLGAQRVERLRQLVADAGA